MIHEKKSWTAESKDTAYGGLGSESRILLLSFRLHLGKHFSDERGLPLYLVEIGFLEYLWISGEIRYLNALIGYIQKLTICKEACVVHVGPGAVIHVHVGAVIHVHIGAVIHDYEVEWASWSKKCHSWEFLYFWQWYVFPDPQLGARMCISGPCRTRTHGPEFKFGARGRGSNWCYPVEVGKKWAFRPFLSRLFWL